MKTYQYCLVAVLLSTAPAWGQVGEMPLGPTQTQDGVEVLTRGPVHEAFAGTVTFDPQPGIITPQTPPDAIEEIPPEVRPEGTNVAWIPGYWAWDDERNDFLWVSGIWRELPPGRQWVPGYWANANQGVQWTSGYWADGTADEVEYLPEPPATVEAGPNVPAASPDQIWLPGCWLWQQNRYAWRPGYWANGQSDWDWIPAHYVWTPRGYVFVDGYYDYTAAQRGVLFAPVHFNSNVYAQSGYRYSPTTVINPAVFASHLFLRPSYGHYYFGDYYEPEYSSRGFSPWFSFFSSRSGYDPFYAQQRWQHRGNDRWDRQVQEDFTHRREHEEFRPARTFEAQQRHSGVDSRLQGLGSVIVQQLEAFRRTKETPLRFQPVDDRDRQQFGQWGQEAQLHRQQRQKLESMTADPNVAPSSPAGRGKLPRSPFMGKRPDEIGDHQRPPQTHAFPQFDSKRVPQPRRHEQSRSDAVPASPREATAPNRASGVEPKATPTVEPDSAPRGEPKAATKRNPKDKTKGNPRVNKEKVK